MLSGKANASTRPTALGSQLQASVYGNVITQIYGTTKVPLLVIWANNLRTGNSSKKSKKKGVKTYVEAIDFLIGSNPIELLLQFWGNNNNRYPLDFAVQRTASNFTITVADPDFYAVVGVTVELTLSGTFNDYGAQGSVPYGPTTVEIPLWNKALQGPDLNDSSGSRWMPWTYVWQPSDGAVLAFPDAASFSLISGTGFTKIYYAKLSTLNKKQIPSSSFNLTFEPQLGNNTAAFVSAPGQQIIYPHFAGASSASFDLGATGMIPVVKPEVKGSFALYSRGDADFFDMIEDILKSGQIQVGTQLGSIQRGVNLLDQPGTVQRQFFQVLALNLPAATFYQPNTAGSRLYVASRSRPGAGSPTVADTNVNTWNSVFNNTQKAVWYSNPVTVTTTRNKVTATPGGGTNFNSEVFIAELDPSMNAIDTTNNSSGSGGGVATGSITTGQAAGQPALLIAAVFCDDGVFGAFPPLWDDMYKAEQHSWTMIAKRTVYGPSTYSISIPIGSGTNWWVSIVSFKQSQAAGYPKALGNILDYATSLNARAGCRAGGLFGSIGLDSQKKAADWLTEIFTCANTTPFWSGHKLKTVFRSEVSAIGNGATYTAPTAAGPILDITESMLIGSSTGPLVTVIDKTPGIDDNNILQIELVDRAGDYNPSLASWPDAASVALYGPRKDAPQALHEIQDPLIARKLLAIQTRRNSQVVPRSFKAKGKAKLCLLEPMDLVTINDSQMGISKLPVRVVSSSEDDKHNFDLEFEPFIYGTHAPDNLSATAPAPFQPNTNADPGSVNTPIIFEPVPRLSGSLQLWMVTSGASPNYGGNAVYISTDGGVSYQFLGNTQGNGITGVTTADWPIATDPDTTNDLPVDLTESLGVLASFQVADEDNFVYPCYVANGNASIPYGLMTYAVATLTAANKYTLKATGGGTNHLRRCVYGAPALLTDTDHPNGSRWAFLSPSGQGVFKVALDPKWIGKTLHFKFLAVNTFGGGQQTLAAATDYTYAPTGTPGQATGGSNNNYTISGGALTNPTTTTIAMAQATATLLSGLKLNYNARTFTISVPTVPTTYYVTIADPGLTGDAGTALSLTGTCQTSNALVGVAGNIYIGSIVALPAGGGTSTGGGGSSGAQLSAKTLVSYFTGLPPTAGTLLAFKTPVPMQLPANLSGSKGRLDVNPTGTAVYNIQQNGVGVATISISTGGVFTFATTGGVAILYAAGDEFKLISPSPQDATLANVGLALIVNE